MHDVEHQPGDLAPEPGDYEALTVLGGLTNVRVRVIAGERLPALPRGQTWRKAQRGIELE